jgi:hypothetical protein
VLILKLPRHWWSLPLIGEEEDDGMWWRSSRCPSLGCLAHVAEWRPKDGVEWNDLSSSNRPLGPTLSLISRDRSGIWRFGGISLWSTSTRV